MQFASRVKRAWKRYRAAKAVQKLEQCLPMEDVSSRHALRSLIEAMDKDANGAKVEVIDDRRLALLQVIEICDVAERFYLSLQSADDDLESSRRHGLIQQNKWLRDEVSSLLNPPDHQTVQ